MTVAVLLLSVFVTVQAQPVLSVIGEDFALPDFGLRIDEADAMFEEKQEYIDTLLLESEELEMLKEEDLLEDVAEKVASIEAKEAESIAKVEEAEAEYALMLMDVPGPGSERFLFTAAVLAGIVGTAAIADCVRNC